MDDRILARNIDEQRKFGLAHEIIGRRVPIVVPPELQGYGTPQGGKERVRPDAEEFFRGVSATAPVMIWMSGIDKLCTYFNEGWLQFTGRTLDQELGNGWAEGVHAEDFDACLDTYTKAFDLREPFRMEYRL